MHYHCVQDAGWRRRSENEGIGPQPGLGLCRETLPSQQWLPGRRWYQHRRHLRPGCLLSTGGCGLRRDQDSSSHGGPAQTNAGQDQSTLRCRLEASVGVFCPMQTTLLSSQQTLRCKTINTIFTWAFLRFALASIIIRRHRIWMISLATVGGKKTWSCGQDGSVLT